MFASNWLDALRPVWPNGGAVVLAILLFLVGSTCFGLAANSLLDEPSRSAVVVPLRRMRRPHVAAFLGLLGTGLYIGLLVRLGTHQTGPGICGVFLFSWCLVLGAVWLNGTRSAPVLRRPSGAMLLEVAYVSLMSGLFFVLSTFDIKSWYYSCWGDEFVHWAASKTIVDGQPFAHPLSQNGVLNIIPALSSWCQGELMRVFGAGLVGWKVSSIVPVLVSLPLLYLLARKLYGCRVAVLALAMLASSHYLIATAHTGYPILEPILPTVACLLLFTIGIARGSAAVLVVSGLAAGFGWYTHYSSRAACVILGLVIIATVPRGSRVRAALTVTAGFLLAVLPMVVLNGTELITKMLEQSFTHREAAIGVTKLTVMNAGRSALAFNYNTSTGHYVAGSLAEPVTAALLVLGLGYSVATWRSRRSRLLLLWYVVAVVVTGVLSKYDHVSVTRLNYALPAVVVFAAVAADRTLAASQRMSAEGKGKWLGIAACVLLIGAITTSNLYRWFVQEPRVVRSSVEAVTIRVLESSPCVTARVRAVIVDVGEGGAIRPAMEARGSQMPEIGLYGGDAEWLRTSADRCVIFRSPSDIEAIALMEEIERRLPGHLSVEERDLSGITRIRVYYPAGR